MRTQIKTDFLFYTFTLFLCLNSFFLSNTAAQVDDEPVSSDYTFVNIDIPSIAFLELTASSDFNYTFESIDVPGVHFLELTSSTDFEDYAGNTRNPDGDNIVGFTLIDGVWTTYHFPGAKNTYFYALGNNGNAAGYYEDSNGLHHGVILEDGELRQYDFPDAVQTEIYGMSDATGVLTGNYIDASGVRRGFSGETIIEIPGASETYADFVNASGNVVGSYVDSEGIYHMYILAPGRITSLNFPHAENIEYLFAHGANQALIYVVHVKRVGDVPRTYVGGTQGLHEFRFPGSVSTEGWNINQDGSVVGYYDTADGRRHGFIARPTADTAAHVSGPPVDISLSGATYTFESIDVPGVHFLELTASSDFEDYAGYTRSADGEKNVAFTLIDGVFSTYDFPASRNTYFYALGNNGNAAGYYEDSDGLFHGVILENGELRQYDFPGAVQTFIHGISDATGALTGNYIDTSGVQRGFSGDIIVEFPEAAATYAGFVNEHGSIVGSYVDAEGIYEAYVRTADGRFLALDYANRADLHFTDTPELEYIFLHGISDVGVIVARSKAVGDVPRTYVGGTEGLHELRFPGSVSTEGWNINQDGSVVGHYDTADGRRHGFIARPTAETDAPVEDPPFVSPVSDNYTFETIDIPDVHFLALTASSDFEDYAGYTKSADGEKEIAFTLIDGVFNTYDFPDSQKTHFYALGNNGNAAGHYQDSDGLYHGVVLENGGLRQYDFPNAVQTEIYGISDATGALTGNFIDASGVRRGFSGDTIIEVPNASATYSDFVNASGGLVGSYIDTEGGYHPYIRTPNGDFIPFTFLDPPDLEYFFVHGVNDAGFIVARGKLIDDIPRTFIGALREDYQELQVPGSVSTEGWNINQDGSIVGHYDSADGRRHGFIARPVAEVSDESVVIPTISQYTFENIDVPGVDFLALTASNDLEDYAGYTKSADGAKDVAFTLIDGVFTTYDFPGSQKTHFYALGNNGNAAGHYQNSDGLYHGVVLENGELRQYDFPDAVETQIFGISDVTGALTGNFMDADGVRRGFSADEVIEVPGASATYANFMNAIGLVVGSYIDAEGIYHAYVRPPNAPDGAFFPFDLPNPAELEYLFVHHMSDDLTAIAGAKRVGDVPRTYIGTLEGGIHDFQFPGSVSTQGWNVNQDGSVVGHYDSADGRRHGFIARPANKVRSDYFKNVYTVTLSKGLNMLSVPLAPPKPMNAKSLVAMTGATTIIKLDKVTQRFIAWTPSAPDDGFPIEGGKGYIVNVPQARNFAFVGAPWTTDPAEATDAAAAPAISAEMPQETWAFVVSGHLAGKPAYDRYHVSVRNLRTNSMITASVRGDYFAAANADLARRSVVKVGDVIELRVIGPDGNVESQPRTIKVTPEHLANALLSVTFDSIGQPLQNKSLQNYPNPFNPETWIPYQLSEDSSVSISIYGTTGKLVRTLSLGIQSAGFYNSRGRAAYWDGKNAVGEPVASGVYFYTLTAGDFTATRKMLIRK